MDEQSTKIQRVVVIDLDMKFSSMVTFLVKLAIAFIPAAIIIAIYIAILSAVFGGLLSALSNKG